MRINSIKLRQLIREAALGLSDGQMDRPQPAQVDQVVERLAQALPKSSASDKQNKLAERKIRNWMNGKLQPTPSAADCHAIAGALGVPMGEFARWTSQFRFARSADTKAKLVVDLIRGRDIDEADTLLRTSPKRAATMVRKVLLAAVADAEQANADVSRLVVSQATADDAVIIKRFQPKDRGRAHPIHKRTSHITVSVEEAR